MRVILLHQSPGADSVAADFVRAAEEFNHGLDVRLRFLDVGFTVRSVKVEESDELAAVEFSETVGSFRPGAIVVCGVGPRLLECVSAGAKAGLFLIYFLAGARDRTAAAVARLADLVVTDGPGLPGFPGFSGLDATALDDRPAGPVLVDLILRSVKERQHP